MTKFLAITISSKSVKTMKRHKIINLKPCGVTKDVSGFIIFTATQKSPNEVLFILFGNPGTVNKTFTACNPLSQYLIILLLPLRKHKK